MNMCRQCNTIIETLTGEGFRFLALPSLLATCRPLVVTSKMMGHQYYKNTGYVTIHSVAKYIESVDHSQFKYILIDACLPRAESKAHKALLKLCKDKQIIFLQHPHDVRALSSAMELMSVTKNIQLKSIKFNQFQFAKRNYK